MTNPGPAPAVMRTLPVKARAPRRRKPAAAVVTVTLYDPRKLAILRTAAALGVPLSVSFDGYRLTIRAAEKRDV